ncbi:MAG: class I SAM-dependent methyltransferase [Planctomycetota bacterium]
MRPKPRHLAGDYPSQFKDGAVVDAYRFRPPYPRETFTILFELLGTGPPIVLDVGCGSGELARGLVKAADRVDAVDFSENMIRWGRTRKGGGHPRLKWIVSPVEEAHLEPPYGLVTAGQSLHWMDWEVVLPRMGRCLVPGGFLAVVNTRISSPPWGQELGEIIPKFSTNQDYEPYDLVRELESRGLFSKSGEAETAPVGFHQTVDHYIESFHSANGFSRERMDPDAARHFDEAVARIAQPHCPEGFMTLEVTSWIQWGFPASE